MDFGSSGLSQLSGRPNDWIEHWAFFNLQFGESSLSLHSFSHPDCSRHGSGVDRGDASGFGVGVGVGLGDAFGAGVGDAFGVGDALGVGEGFGVGVGAALAVALAFAYASAAATNDSRRALEVASFFAIVTESAFIPTVTIKAIAKMTICERRLYHPDTRSIPL